jgi:hypothetical protein
MRRKKATDAQRRKAFAKVNEITLKAQRVQSAGYDDWADRLSQQAFAIERDYGGFADLRLEERRVLARENQRREEISLLFDIVMSPEVRKHCPRTRRWASAAIDELKHGGPLLGEGHKNVGTLT